MPFQTLLSALVLHSHNVRILHWNLTGIDFDPVHEKLGSYYDLLDEIVDEVAEIGLQVGIQPVGLFEAFTTLKEDPRTYVSLSGSKKFTSAEAFQLIGQMFTGILELYTETCGDSALTPDIVNKLQEHMFKIRKELQYKNVARLT